VRLDHLLSKEYLSIVGGHCVPPDARHFQLVHWWAVVSDLEVDRDSVPPSSERTPATVFSSVLRESFRRSPTPLRRARFQTGCSACVCRTLRTAEQARASLFFQATKSQRWMPWRQEPMKDVSDCEKLRGAVD
jgi:hypothetical protein